MIQEILDRSGKAQREIVPPQRKSISGCQIEAPIPTEPIRVLAEVRIAKHRSQIRTRSEKIGAYPEPLDVLRNHERNLVVRYPERFSVGAGESHDRGPAKVADVAVCKRIRGEY